MSTHSGFSKFILTALFLLTIASFLFISCEKEREVLVPKSEHETFTLVIIAADTLSNPDSVAQGSIIRLTVDVSHLPEKDNLTFDWNATGGAFDSDEGDTVTWKAPDDPGAYTITAHADAGNTNVYKGTRHIGVGLYAPTVIPYYVGGERCQSCHAILYNAWEETAHAHAWATLEESDHAASYCNRCHTVDTEEITGNSGYDDAAISLYENVQCESCHGTGSDHAASPSTAFMQVDYAANGCGTCHEGTHHPYLSEWQQSPHSFNAATDHAATNTNCQGCHEGVAALHRLSDAVGLSSFYGGGAISREDTTEISLQPVVCQTCHNPHINDNPGQLITTADVHLVTANGESPVITDGGTGKLCMHCHHARNSAEEQIESGESHFGPHASLQADMMAGKSAYHGVADQSFTWADPSHLHVQNSCKTCHLNTMEYISEENPAKTGHYFFATVEACKNCHGPISDFNDIKALEDFDGDGVIEGIQSEVAGLLDILREEIVSSGLDTTAGFVEALGDTTKSTEQQRAAGFNWVFVSEDKSLGIHNPDYTIQLLQQSIQYITGSPLNKAAVLNNKQAVAKF